MERPWTDLMCISHCTLRIFSGTGFRISDSTMPVTCSRPRSFGYQAVAFSPMQVIWPRFHPYFEEEHPGGGEGYPTSPPLPPTSREDLRLNGPLLARVPPCRKGTIRLQASIPSPEFEPWPYGIAVIVFNRYTG
ncbi:hypothetical protein TNCV_268191 [Trichonephila clavipes]|nr:hypothetical protein TNCV_268191 [Trichonephila clavipes]